MDITAVYSNSWVLLYPPVSTGLAQHNAPIGDIYDAATIAAAMELKIPRKNIRVTIEVPGTSPPVPIHVAGYYPAANPARYNPIAAYAPFAGSHYVDCFNAAKLFENLYGRRSPEMDAIVKNLESEAESETYRDWSSRGLPGSRIRECFCGNRAEIYDAAMECSKKMLQEE